MTAIDPGIESLERLSAGHPLAVKALRELRWAQTELAEIVRIVQPHEDADDAVDLAVMVSAIRRLIEADPERYLELIHEAAKIL